MTLAEGITLTNCGKGRSVLLYVEDASHRGITIGDPVNDICEFPCDDREDVSGKPVSGVSEGIAQFDVTFEQGKPCPHCNITECKFHQS